MFLSAAKLGSILVLTAAAAVRAGAFVHPQRLAVATTRLRSASGGSTSSSEWTVADDWSRLSSDPSSTPIDTEKIFNTDLAADAARSFMALEQKQPKRQDSEEDIYVRDAVDAIQHFIDPNDPPLYDTASSFEDYVKGDDHFEDAAREIGLLVRCNERPQDLLESEGRALPPLQESERYDVRQMIIEDAANAAEDGSSEDGSDGTTTTTYRTTPFFDMAVAQIFHEHATGRQVVAPSQDAREEEGNGDEGEEEVSVLDPSGVARWMTKSLGDGDLVGQHDKRVNVIISRYGTYGSGFLTEAEFHKLYFDAVVVAMKEERKEPIEARAKALWKKSLKVTQPTVRTVWRDFANHGIRPPAEEERMRLEAEMEAKFGGGTSTAIAQVAAAATGADTIMDECEILEWGEDDHSNPRSYFDIGSDDGGSGGEKATRRKSSYEYVELASDNKTPKRVRDGSFVFIDEESCIGCTQCAQIAPSSFVMLENGRARTFSQSSAPENKAAVAACPVSCMHSVSFRELKKFETARDKGDGRTDHRHLGNPRGHIPLNVAGIDSDANRKSSWYHTLRHNCYVSKSCPQKGCYDCPFFSAPGENPYFKKRHAEAERVRYTDLVNSGEADMYRKTADL